MKNKGLKLIHLLILTLLAGIIFTGCKSSVDVFTENEVNPEIDVFGVKLYMVEAKVHELIGSKGEKAMCIYGYEYQYDDKLINIGFDSESKLVRRVTSKNPETLIYGIKPGIELLKAYEIIELEGFKRADNSKYRFYKENIILTIISMKGNRADGITVEMNPDLK